MRIVLATPALPEEMRSDFFDGHLARHFDLVAFAELAGVTLIRLLAALAMLHRSGYIRREFDRNGTGIHLWLNCRVQEPRLF